MGVKELIEISRHYGKNPDYVLANGGNTSWKNNESMYVKASGVSLADIDESGFVKMSREKLAAIWQKNYPEDADMREEEALADLMAARKPGEDKRPSVEALLHALFPQAYVVHLHPALVNGMTCGQKGRESAEKLFGSRSVWVPVVNPGYILAKTVKDVIDRHQAEGNEFPGIVFLQNHGVFVAGETLEEIKTGYGDIISTLEKQVERKPDLSELPEKLIDKNEINRWQQAVLKVLGKGECSFLINREIDHLVKSKKAFRPLASSYTPDHIVYYGHKPLFIEVNIGDRPAGGGEAEELIQSAFESYAQEYPDNPPRIIAVEGIGVFPCGDSKKRVELIRDLFIDAVKISVYTRSFGGPLFMPKDKIDFIVNWEVEKYRSSMQGK